MRSLLLPVLCSLALVFAGCAINLTHGTEIPAAKLEALTIGTTTRDEVVAMFGKPDATREFSDGRTLLRYTFSRSRINPPSIETMSGLTPKTELTGIQVTLFIFDSSGRLTSYAGERSSGNAVAAPEAEAASAPSRS